MAEPPRVRGLIGPLLVRLFVRDWKHGDRQVVRVRIGVLAAVLGIVVNFFMFVLKLAAGLLIASLSLIADAIDSFGDMLTAIVTLIGFKVSARAPDYGHPYGHERAEEIAALVVATLLIVAGVQFGFESVRRLASGRVETAFHILAVGVAALSMVVKFGLSRMSFQFATAIQSGVLRGNAWNYLLDVLSSLLVLVALAGRRFGYYWVDPIIAILISLLIVRVGYGLFREAADHLLGKGGTEQEVDEIHKVACGQPGVLGCADIEVHKYGRKRRVSLRVQVSDALTLREAHAVAEQVEKSLMGAHADWEPVVHVDPVARSGPAGNRAPPARTD